ncbi:ligase-associated DNA damage response endonuclease PdeM [Pseudorhodobacter sp.]|uniref:ligase-associated DNA damage response endonuclease PdeM n=1 Tax=Pseudorhodobacter sp. TaxID=1934400 RepID=UPI0026499F9D|nr:ligase-associated DNA damage response endonuclease PdeM [Pseudorhodobacter sp.]MDN5787967.1 ligase-associated DNA damage response endonuclease PdeM [Pseudorhodobacter sp.]
MTGHHFSLAEQPLVALPSGALHWPSQHLLCVSDLHLGKSERLARRGGALLPPYEIAETLTRLDADITATQPATVICLGDSFDDPTAAQEMTEVHRLWLLRLMAGRDWVWVAGNHDPEPVTLGGCNRAEWQRGPLRFRHIAETGATGEISGHYHPKARLKGRARPCFLLSRERLILPAYGTYTGGLWCDDPVLSGLLTAPALVILTGAQCLAIPLLRPNTAPCKP